MAKMCFPCTVKHNGVLVPANTPFEVEDAKVLDFQKKGGWLIAGTNVGDLITDPEDEGTEPEGEGEEGEEVTEPEAEQATTTKKAGGKKGAK